MSGKMDQSPLDHLECPSYGQPIPISETIYHQVSERVERELQAKAAERERMLAAKERELQEKDKALDRLVQDEVNRLTIGLRVEAEQNARQSVSLELEDLRRQAAQQNERLQAAQQAELKFRKHKRDLEERERTLELETARRLDQERRRIEEETAKRITEQHRLHDAEKDKKL